MSMASTATMVRFSSAEAPSLLAKSLPSIAHAREDTVLKPRARVARRRGESSSSSGSKTRRTARMEFSLDFDRTRLTIFRSRSLLFDPLTRRRKRIPRERLAFTGCFPTLSLLLLLVRPGSFTSRCLRERVASKRSGRSQREGLERAKPLARASSPPLDVGSSHLSPNS